jgi:hypothetical protein
MFLVLKIPVVAALVLIWYAIREPAPADGDRTDGGGGGSPHPRLRPPRGPRRGPHAAEAPPAPSRVRTAVGGREHERR